MADIEFRIGGKDDTGKAIASATKGLSRLELSFGQIVKAAGGFAAVNASINLVSRGLSNLVGLVAGGVNDFDKAQEAARGLAKAMELNGGTTDDAVQKNLDLADAIERTTNIEAEQVSELMKSAAMLGVNNDQLGEVSKAAIGLSEAMGISLEDGLKKARLATEGNFSSFNKLLPSLKNMASDEERLAAVMELANKGLIQKEAAANGSSEAYARMTNRVGNMMEKVGEALSPFRKLAFDGIGFVADKISELLIPAVASMGGIIESAQGWFSYFREAVVGAMNGIIMAFTAAETIVANFGTYWESILVSAELALVTFVEASKYAFTVQIPAYATWFGENFTKIMADAFNATVTIASNLADKIGGILTRLWDFVSSGMEGGFSALSSDIGKIAAGSLLEGFEATTAALPDIAARALTDREKDLSGRLGKLAGTLAEDFNQRLSGRLISTDEIASEIGKTSLAMAGGGAAEDKSAKGVADMLGGGGGGGGGGTLQASTGRLLTRGPGSDVPDLLRKLIDVTKEVGVAASAQAMAAESAQRIAAENNAAINSALANAPKLAPALQ